LTGTTVHEHAVADAGHRDIKPEQQAGIGFIQDAGSRRLVQHGKSGHCDTRTATGMNR